MRTKMLEAIFVPNMDSSYWVAILLHDLLVHLGHGFVRRCVKHNFQVSVVSFRLRRVYY